MNQSLTPGSPPALPWLALVATLFLMLPLHSATADDDGDDSPLPEAIVYRDAQEGFAGVSGQEVVVKPDGSWSRRRFLNQTKQPPHAAGTLSAAQLRAVSDALQTAELESLPEKFGTNPPVNRHLVTISVGETSRTLVLRGGQSVEESRKEKGSETWKKFADLVVLIDRLASEAPATFARLIVQGHLKEKAIECPGLIVYLEGPASADETLETLQGQLVRVRGPVRQKDGRLWLRAVEIEKVNPTPSGSDR